MPGVTSKRRWRREGGALCTFCINVICDIYLIKMYHVFVSLDFTPPPTHRALRRSENSKKVQLPPMVELGLAV